METTRDGASDDGPAAVDLSCLEYVEGSEGYQPWSVALESDCAIERTIESCRAREDCSPSLGLPVTCHAGSVCGMGTEPVFLGCVPLVVCDPRDGIDCRIDERGNLHAYVAEGSTCPPPLEYGVCRLDDPLTPEHVPSCG